MAKRISELDPAASVGAGDLLEITQVGATPTTKRATIEQVRGVPTLVLKDENVVIGNYHTISFSGMPVTVVETAPGEAQVIFTGAGATEPYVLSCAWNGLIGVDGELISLLRAPISQQVTFPANFAGSYAVSEIPATYETDFHMYKNGNYVGTVTFAAGATVGTFVSASGAAVVFNPGDVFKFETDWYLDPSLANLGVTFVGAR